VNVADWPGARVVDDDPVHDPDTHVGPLDSAPAGAVCVSSTPTDVKVTFPVLLTTNW
jgi:hypothetical protein